MIIISPPPKNPNASSTSTAALLPDGSGAIVDANGTTVATLTSYSEAIAYLQHINRHPVG